jgi:hypothetical protein
MKRPLRYLDLWVALRENVTVCKVRAVRFSVTLRKRENVVCGAEQKTLEAKRDVPRTCCEASLGKLALLVIA